MSAPPPAAPVPALATRNLSVTYRSSRGMVPAIDGLSMTLRDGEFLSVLGPSGCGKSTLIKVVSGLLRPSGGDVLLRGHPVAGPSPDVGMVFQQPTLLPWLSVLDNVFLPIRSLKRDRAAGRRRANELIRLVKLERFVDHYPGELSGGMQQRVGIARSLVHEPALLLMDEPLAALDAMTREHMMVELQRVWLNTGCSVVYITHSIPEAVFLSDRVLVLSSRPGRIVREVAVDLPRPRGIDTLGAPAFVGICNDLRLMFQEVE